MDTSIGLVAWDDHGNTLEARGTLVGTDPTLEYRVALTAAGFARIACALPNGRVKLGDEVPVSVGGASLLLEAGVVDFAVETFQPVEPLKKKLGCPKGHGVLDVRFVTATILLFQGDQVVDLQTYDLSAEISTFDGALDLGR